MGKKRCFSGLVFRERVSLDLVEKSYIEFIKQEQIRDKYQDICAPNEEDNYTWVKIVAKDLDENIRRIVDGFPPRLQCVYMLRQEQNLSIKEIAEKLAVSEQPLRIN